MTILFGGCHEETTSAIDSGRFSCDAFRTVHRQRIKKDTIFSENENRYLAGSRNGQRRVFGRRIWTEFETYLADQFLGRDAWVNAKTLAELAMGKGGNGVFAKDGYLIERHDGMEPPALCMCSHLSQFIAAQTETLGEGRFSPSGPRGQPGLTDKLPACRRAGPAGNCPVTCALSCQRAAWMSSRSLQAHRIRISTIGLTITGRPEAYYAYRTWMIARETPWQLDDFKVEPISHSFLGTVYSKAGIPLQNLIPCIGIVPSRGYPGHGDL